MEQGTVVEWRCREGQQVRRGDVVLLIESEKVEFEVEAAEAGVLRSIVVREGETVPCGELLAVLTEGPDQPVDIEAFLSAARLEREERLRVPTPAEAGRDEHLSRRPAQRRASPRARRLAEREGVDLASLEGTGPGGRITEEDVRRAVELLGPRITVGAARVAYADLPGADPPVAFLAGFGIDRTAFKRTLADLAGWRRLLAPDPRGTGASTDPDETPLGIEHLADDVLAILDSLAVKRADLVGSSLGAAVAVELARRSPERVRRLALLSPPAQPDARLAAALDGFCRAAETGDPDLRLRAMTPWLFGRAFFADGARVERALGALVGAVARVSPRTLRRQKEALVRWLERAPEAYTEVRAPTLIVVGTDDLLTPMVQAEAAGTALPGPRLERFDGVGHAPMVEAPERLHVLLRQFLGSPAILEPETS